MLSPNKCLLEAAIAKGKPAHSALLALLCSAALVLGAWPGVSASTVSLVSDPPPQPLSAWQMEKVGASFPPQWLPVLLGFPASSPKATGHVLAQLAMLSTASGWVIPSHGEANDSALSSHEATITDGVGGARNRRGLAICDHGWSASLPRLCYMPPWPLHNPGCRRLLARSDGGKVCTSSCDAGCDDSCDGFFGPPPLQRRL